MAKPASGSTLDSGHSLAANLVLALPFTEGSGLTSQDVSTGGRTWTRGSITWDTEGGDAVVSNASEANNGLLSSTLSVAGNQNWSAAWRSKHAANLSFGVMAGVASSNLGMIYMRNDSGNRSCRFRDGSNNTGTINQADTFSTSVEDYVLTYDHAAQLLELWRDGVSVGSVSYTAGADWQINSVIGGSTNPLAHTGTLHYFYLWDGRKLNSTEIGSLHTDPYSMLDAPGGDPDSVTISHAQMVLRNGSTGSMAVSGTYSSADAHTVQVRILRRADDAVVHDWADVDTSLSLGVWSAIMNPDTGGPYYTECRLLDVSDNVIVTANDGPDFIVCELVALWGQSNIPGRGINNQTYGGSSVAWAFKESGAVDTTLSDPISDDVDAAGSWLPLFATLLSAKLGAGVPLGFVVYGVGGTGLDETDWLPPTGPLWLDASARIDTLAFTDMRAVIWLQGERDAGQGVSKATYQSREVILAEAVATLPGAPPLMTILIGQYDGKPDSALDAIREARIANWEASETLPGANPIDIDLLTGGDGLHYKTDAVLAELAARIYLAYEENFLGGTNGRGPRLVSAVRSGTTITLLMDKDLTSATTYTTSAFIVKDDGTPVTVSSVAQAGAREVRLTLAATPSGTVTVTFGSGDDAIGATIPRAKSVALPATINSISSVSLPAEPIYNVTVNVGQVQRIKNNLLLGIG